VNGVVRKRSLSTSFEFFLLEIAGDEFVGFILSGLDVIKKFGLGVTGFHVDKFFVIATSLEVIDGILSYFEIVVGIAGLKLGGTLGGLGKDNGSTKSDDGKSNGSANHDE